MKPARMTPLLNVLDIRASISFYETIGFTVTPVTANASQPMLIT